MNAQTTLRELIRAVRDQKWGRVERLCGALLRLSIDGQVPRTIGPMSLGKSWHQSLTYAVYARALAEAEAARADRRKSRRERRSGRR